MSCGPDPFSVYIKSPVVHLYKHIISYSIQYRQGKKQDSISLFTKRTILCMRGITDRLTKIALVQGSAFITHVCTISRKHVYNETSMKPHQDWKSCSQPRDASRDLVVLYHHLSLMDTARQAALRPL